MKIKTPRAIVASCAPSRDWILRAAQRPAGEGELILRFEPEVYAVSKNVSRASSIVLILLTLLAAAGCLYNRERGE